MTYTRNPKQEIEPWMMEYFLTGEEPADPWQARAFMAWKNPRKTWRAIRDEILPEWIRQNPGKRPFAWWIYDAPEQRQRLGGTGTPCDEVLNETPFCAFGIPVSWVDAWEVEYYNGRAVDVHGEPIGRQHKEGSFSGVAIDPEDPPRYESQAAYLKRHGLLTPAEEKRLSDSDFEPETLKSERK